MLVQVGIAVDILQMHMTLISRSRSDVIDHMWSVISPMADVSMPCVDGHTKIGVSDLAHKVDPRRRIRVVAILQDECATHFHCADQHRANEGGGGLYQAGIDVGVIGAVELVSVV